MLKNAFGELGFGLSPDLTVTDKFNVSMIQKTMIYENKVAD
jgi:hypothetical protein